MVIAFLDEFERKKFTKKNSKRNILRIQGNSIPSQSGRYRGEILAMAHAGTSAGSSEIPLVHLLPHLLPLHGRKILHLVHFFPHLLPLLGGKLPEAPICLPELLFFLGRQLLPTLKILLQARLLLRGQLPELLQTLPQQILLVFRHLPEAAVKPLQAFPFRRRKLLPLL